MMTPLEYIKSVLEAFRSLLVGMKRTFSSLIHTKRVLTQEYPENRATLYIPERFKAQLELKYDDADKVKCVACMMCQNSCPNGTIEINTETITTPEGKPKKVVARYLYHLGQCTFCGQCVDVCNFDALAFNNHFENSQYLKELTEKTLYPRTTSNEQ